ncbi:MAG: hypothetical protein NTW21_40780 [Verrucomicrobia bacterium]|nr:hypothetical protein [Verrucomicrobiota bacterium]
MKTTKRNKALLTLAAALLLAAPSVQAEDNTVRPIPVAMWSTHSPAATR